MYPSRFQYESPKTITEAIALLDRGGGSVLRGKIAIANAKLAYERYLEIVAGARWKALADPIAEQVVGSIAAPISRLLTSFSLTLCAALANASLTFCVSP